MSKSTPRTFLTSLGDREVPITIVEEEAGRYRVTLDGQELSLDVRRIGGHVVSLLVDGRGYEVSVIRKGDEYDLLVANHRYRVPLVPEMRARAARAGAAAVSGRQEIKASMPGKVVDVLVKVGDTVEPKQGILVVEAMKMENEIHSPGAGEVKEIRVKPGQAVEAGELLIVVE